MSPSRAVLITGVHSQGGHSSGTGRATALRLHRAGWPVYATGRNLEGLKDLADEGITTLQVVVTDEESMVAAVDRITEEHGAVGVLINNAAYSLNGTIGETPLDQVRRQFDTNFFGLSRMTQLVLPGMREQRSGQITVGDLDLDTDSDLYTDSGSTSSSGTAPIARSTTPRAGVVPRCARARSRRSSRRRSPRASRGSVTGSAFRSDCSSHSEQFRGSCLGSVPHQVLPQPGLPLTNAKDTDERT